MNYSQTKVVLVILVVLVVILRTVIIVALVISQCGSIAQERIRALMESKACSNFIGAAVNLGFRI